MTARRRLGISYRRATVVSIALHLLALLALVRVFSPPPREAAAQRRIPSEVVRISHIAFVPVAPRMRPPPMREAIVSRTRPPAIARAMRKEPPVRTPIRSHLPVTVAVVAPRYVAATSNANVIVDATAQPTAPASVQTPAPVVLAQTRVSQDDAAVPSGGWGENLAQPIVADDAALATVRANLRTTDTFTVEVAVDADGHATRVALPAGIADDVRDAIEAELLALRYVPAECNGLRCAGTLRIAL